MIEVIGGRRLEDVPLGGVLILLTTGLIVWVRYLRWSGEAAFIRAVAPLPTGRGARLILRAGYAAPLLLIALTILIPPISALTLLPAGALMAGAQLYKKALLILAAGQFRPITLADLTVPRHVSNRRTS